MKLIKKFVLSILILMLPLSVCLAREIITGIENEEGNIVLTEEGIGILNEELRKLSTIGRFITLTATNIDGIVGANTPAVGTFTTLTLTGAAPSPPAIDTIYKDNVVKAWINFNGTSGDFGTATRDSFNVSGITDRGTGEYTVTWDTDFANENYVVVMQNYFDPGVQENMSGLDTQSAGSINIITGLNSDGTLTDSAIVCVMAIGDQ